MILYQPGESLLHRTDAVSKFVWLFSVAAAATILTDLRFIVVILALVVLTAFGLARLRPRTLARRALPFLLIGGWLVVVFTVANVRHGATPLHIGPLTSSVESARYGLAIGCRVLTLGLASVVFVLTTEPRRLVTDLIAYGHVPYRMGFAVYAALRFLPQIQTEARTISNAHAVRAVEQGSGIVSRAKALPSLTVPLLSGALRRVQVTAIAMDSRGFGAHPTRTELDRVRPAAGGIALAAAHVLLVVLAVVLLVTGQVQGVQSPIGG